MSTCENWVLKNFPPLASLGSGTAINALAVLIFNYFNYFFHFLSQRLSHLNKDYLLTYLLTYTTNGTQTVHIHRWEELQHLLISLNALAIASSLAAGSKTLQVADDVTHPIVIEPRGRPFLCYWCQLVTRKQTARYQRCMHTDCVPFVVWLIQTRKLPVEAAATTLATL